MGFLSFFKTIVKSFHCHELCLGFSESINFLSFIPFTPWSSILLVFLLKTTAKHQKSEKEELLFFFSFPFHLLSDCSLFVVTNALLPFCTVYFFFVLCLCVSVCICACQYRYSSFWKPNRRTFSLFSLF